MRKSVAMNSAAQHSHTHKFIETEIQIGDEHSEPGPRQKESFFHTLQKDIKEERTVSRAIAEKEAKRRKQVKWNNLKI